MKVLHQVSRVLRVRKVFSNSKQDNMMETSIQKLIHAKPGQSRDALGVVSAI